MLTGGCCGTLSCTLCPSTPAKGHAEAPLSLLASYNPAPGVGRMGSQKVFKYKEPDSASRDWKRHGGGKGRVNQGRQSSCRNITRCSHIQHHFMALSPYKTHAPTTCPFPAAGEQCSPPSDLGHQAPQADEAPKMHTNG